jgi:hypothetical protein
MPYQNNKNYQQISCDKIHRKKAPRKLVLNVVATGITALKDLRVTVFQN